MRKKRRKAVIDNTVESTSRRAGMEGRKSDGHVNARKGFEISLWQVKGDSAGSRKG